MALVGRRQCMRGSAVTIGASIAGMGPSLIEPFAWADASRTRSLARAKSRPSQVIARARGKSILLTIHFSTADGRAANCNIACGAEPAASRVKRNGHRTCHPARM
jgi:hypothetical protein